MSTLKSNYLLQYINSTTRVVKNSPVGRQWVIRRTKFGANNSKKVCCFQFGVILKDTACMFLFHRRLVGVDGFADAAELEERVERTGSGHKSLWLPTYHSVTKQKHFNGS